MILHYLDDIELNPLIKVGSWNKNYGTNFTRNFTEAYSELVDSLGNKTLIITTILVGVFSLYCPNEPLTTLLGTAESCKV